MLYTVDRVNSSPDGTVLPPGVKMGAYILDDCDKDTYGLQQAVEFIKGDGCLAGEEGGGRPGWGLINRTDGRRLKFKF